MKDVFARLGADFFSTILFIAIYLATDNVLLATGVAIAGAIAQVIYSRVKGKELGYMTWASLALVIVLGSATLLTHDPRFVLAKPAVGHFAIGAIMLKRGWMLRRSEERRVGKECRSRCDWSSDVCSSDLQRDPVDPRPALRAREAGGRAFCNRRHHAQARLDVAQIGRASCRERV